MSGDAPRDDGMIAGINMTPFVDVMLVLLVIFIVTAKIVVAPAVPVELPSAGSAKATAIVLAITVSADGALAINGEPITDRRELVRRSEAAVADNPAVQVVIQADGRARHAEVLGVLDLLGEAGVKNAGFGAAPP